MKTIEVNKLVSESAFPALEKVSAMLDGIPGRNRIETINWQEYSYKPEVTFTIAYSDNEIFLKYYVKENFLKAEKTLTNQMVCEDSCVEFFISPDDDGVYYNIEFNAIGTCLLGTGTARENSTQANPEIVSRIRRLSSEGDRPFKEKEGEFDWTLTVAIPYEVFFHHSVRDLKGKTFRANFYKCGDNLKVPHYVTWNPVGTKNPDYHQPEYFGLLKFV